MFLLSYIFIFISVVRKYVDIERKFLVNADTYGHPRSIWSTTEYHLAPLNAKIIFPKMFDSNFDGVLRK